MGYTEMCMQYCAAEIAGKNTGLADDADDSAGQSTGKSAKVTMDADPPEESAATSTAEKKSGVYLEDGKTNRSYTGGRTEKELKALAEDPAHNGSTRPIDIAKGKHEAKVGLELEERGSLKSITRDATGKAEFIDGDGQAWDIKSFNSNYKPNKGGFRLDKAMNTINKSLSENENVIIDTSNMSSEHISELIAEIKKHGIEKIFYFGHRNGIKNEF